MRTIWHSLTWKEWHEHKWKLAAVTLVLWGVTSVAFFETTRDVFPIMWGTMLLGLIPMAVFVGLAAAANEQSRGTLRFLQALPVPMWRVALHKLAFGSLTLIVPTLLTALLILIWWLSVSVDHGTGRVGTPRTFGAFLSSALHRDTMFVTRNWISDIAIMSILLAGSLFLWCAAAGVNRKDEISAGAVALPVMGGYWLLLMTLWSGLVLHSTSDETAPLRAVVVATAPGGALALASIADGAKWPLLLGFIAAILGHGLLAAGHVRRFGHTSEQAVRSPQAAAQAGEYGWLAPPRRSQLSAIAWKQFRESGPIVLAGVAGILVTTTAIIAVTIATWPEARGQLEPREVFRIYAGVSLVFGVVIGMVAGIGVALHDIEPRLNAFWRSTPIQADAWFWSKFLTGLAILLVAIYLPLIIVGWLAQLHPFTSVWSHDDFIYPLVHAAIFAAAVAMTCLVRHAVYAAILSIPLVYLGLVLVWLAIFAASLAGWRNWPVEPFYDMTEREVAVGLIVSFAISTLLGWLAMRYDWGRKSRY